MKKINIFVRLIIILIISIFLLWLSFYFLSIKIDSNFFVALSTLIVGFGAIYIYITQRFDSKEDAAKIIIQEIRRAEDIISDYKNTGSYQFAKKIIATNSWNKNIHYFVDDLSPDELDKISDLYSNGEFLDSQIQLIAKITLEDDIKRVSIQREFNIDQQEEKIKSTNDLTIFDLVQINKNSGKLQIEPVPALWKPRLDQISLTLTLIYHSTIVLKLKKIAGLE
ncbi:MAG TPA: hypothetical protein VMR49_01380 [Candidatus Paceibacterota bacterium]|jgi:hypothetical protein|nr:hypothetical protein [Candidatus Paceibacterota bacterium]